MNLRVMRMLMPQPHEVPAVDRPDNSIITFEQEKVKTSAILRMKVFDRLPENKKDFIREYGIL